MFCPKCGKEANTSDVYCSRCGHKLPEDRVAESNLVAKPDNTNSDNFEDSPRSEQAVSRSGKLFWKILGILVMLLAVFVIGFGIKQKERNWEQNARSISGQSLNAAFNLLNEISKLEHQGRDMESLRKNTSVENLKKCGELMRNRQKIADELSEQCKQLPHPLSFNLSIAAAECKLCVSCVATALSKCDRVRQALAEAEKDIAQVSKENNQDVGNTKAEGEGQNTDVIDAQKIIGQWRDESEPSVMNSTITIYSQNGKYYLQVRFDQGGKTAIEEVTKTGPTKFVRIDHPGDYFVITKSGYLQAKDRDGLVFSAKPIR